METATLPNTGRAAASAQGLVFELEIGPPAHLAVGRGNAFLAAGHCYHPAARMAGVSLELDGERIPATQSGMPREDAFERAAPGAGRFAFHSGFIAMVPVGPVREAKRAELRLVATLADGRELEVDAGTVELVPALRPPEHREPEFPGPAGSRIAISMATYEPPPELLKRQLDSIRAQTHDNWVCLISDDGSSPERLEGLRAEVGDDPRFAIAAASGRLGFYNNFERAAAMAPASADFVALCDQDDRWHPHKLERLLAEMEPGVTLAYGDARIVDERGGVLHPSYWVKRRNNYTNLGSLLIANTITGAAALFRRDLLEDALPFPPRIETPYHDHWLALIALARGRIAYVDEPLYDYVQHEGAALGHAAANRGAKPIRERIRDRLRNPGDGSRVIYFYTWPQLQLFAQVLRARCGESMEPAKRKALDRFLSADTSLSGLAWLLGRRLRRLWGRNETLDVERHLGKALLRRRAVTLGAVGRRRPRRILPRDQSIPPSPIEGEPGGA